MRATKVNAGLAESNGRLLLGIWRDSLHVTCGLTASTPGSAPGPTLGNEYGKNFTFTLPHINLPLNTATLSNSFCLYNNNNNNHLTAVCPGQPGYAGARRNIHPLTPILVNVLPLSPFFICNSPRHPLYSAYVLDVLNPQLHTPCISSPNHHHLFAAHAHTNAACSAAISMLCHLHLVTLSAPYLGVCLLA